MKKYKYFLLLYLLLWIVLFEFILPVNDILPKPSIVLASFGDLWKDYRLPENFLSSITAIYLSMIAAYVLVRFFISGFIKKDSLLAQFIYSLEWFSEFIPGIVIGLMLIYWFPQSEVTEYIFAFLTAFTSMLIRIQKDIPKVPSEYVVTAASLGAEEKILNRYVLWKAVQPSLLMHLVRFHFYLWSMLIAFEFMKGGLGMGSLFRRALEYRDLSALFSGFLITGITIYLGSLSVKYLKNKFYFWKP